jgi:hypothetical protein
MIGYLICFAAGGIFGFLFSSFFVAAKIGDLQNESGNGHQ